MVLICCAAQVRAAVFSVVLDTTVEPIVFSSWLDRRGPLHESVSPRIMCRAYPTWSQQIFNSSVTADDPTHDKPRMIAFDVFDVVVAAENDDDLCVTDIRHVRHALMRRDVDCADQTSFRVTAVSAMRSLSLQSAIPTSTAGVESSDACPSDSVNVSAYFGLSRRHSGRGVRIGLFDTGIMLDQRTKKVFAGTDIRLCVDFTQTTGGRRGADAGDGSPLVDPSCNDGHGHGTFVAGTVAGNSGEGTAPPSIGVAPDASLYVFKVFTDRQQSFTSWFARALTFAMQLDLDVINLSIGGKDYYDDLFNDKIRQMEARGTVIVTANGNGGPAHGSTLSPADLAEVIGVGSVSGGDPDVVSEFSSRGMTTSELPLGLGRPKPDLVTVGEKLCGVSIRGDGGLFRVLSGTSVAAPIVTAAVALALGKMMAEHRMSVKHQKEGEVGDKAGMTHGVHYPSARWLLSQSCDNIRGKSIFSVGMGRLNISRLLELASFSPSSEWETPSSPSPRGIFAHPAQLYFHSCRGDRDDDGGDSVALAPCMLLWPLSANPVYAMAAGNSLDFNVTLYRSTQVLARDHRQLSLSSSSLSVAVSKAGLVGENVLMKERVDQSWLSRVVSVETSCMTATAGGSSLLGFCHVSIFSAEVCGGPVTKSTARRHFASGFCSLYCTTAGGCIQLWISSLMHRYSSRLRRQTPNGNKCFRWPCKSPFALAWSANLCLVTGGYSGTLSAAFSIHPILCLVMMFDAAMPFWTLPATIRLLILCLSSRSFSMTWVSSCSGSLFL